MGTGIVAVDFLSHSQKGDPNKNSLANCPPSTPPPPTHYSYYILPSSSFSFRSAISINSSRFLCDTQSANWC